MNEVTRTAVIESKNAIWEYDPTLESNRVVAGGLDVIAIIRTLAIKVRSILSCLYHYQPSPVLRSRHPDIASLYSSNTRRTAASRRRS